MSRAIVAHSSGGPEVLELIEAPTPEPGPGEVRIAVRAAGVNYTDTLARAGRFGMPLPMRPGHEVVGVVEAVGEGARAVVGSRVMALLAGGGGYAEHALAPASALVSVPDDIDDASALALLVQGTTALLLLRRAARLAPAESIFVPSAAGGVGSLLVQLARAMGARLVVAGATREDKRALALSLGADVAVDTGGETLATALCQATDGRGVDVALAADAPTLLACLPALASGGRLVVYGADNLLTPTALSAEQLTQLLRQSQSIGGFAVLQAPESARSQALAELFERTREGHLRVLATQRFPLEGAAAAHRALEARVTCGKVILQVGA